MRLQGLLVSEELASKVHEAGSQAYRVKKTGLDRCKPLQASSAITHSRQPAGPVMAQSV